MVSDVNAAKCDDVAVEVSAPTPSAPKLPPDWNVADVCGWLSVIGMSLYEPHFRRNAIDGMELMNLTHESLEKNIGIGR